MDQLPGLYPFHIALPTEDLARSREFYGQMLGQRETRSAPSWVDFDFFGHQLSLHLVRGRPSEKLESQLIDGDPVPARHFGMILDQTAWDALRARLEQGGVSFVIGPKLRFAGRVGEQWTLFVKDPSGNVLEFKYFTDSSKGLWY